MLRCIISSSLKLILIMHFLNQNPTLPIPLLSTSLTVSWVPPNHCSERKRVGSQALRSFVTRVSISHHEPTTINMLQSVGKFFSGSNCNFHLLMEPIFGNREQKQSNFLNLKVHKTIKKDICFFFFQCWLWILMATSLYSNFLFSLQDDGNRFDDGSFNDLVAFLAWLKQEGSLS